MDIKKIKAIIDLVKESNIAELEISEGDDKLRVNCGGVNNYPHYASSAIAQHTSSQLASVPTILAAPAEAVAETPQVQGETITSPMVGTFYSASSPSAVPFVTVGQEIKIGQVLCIIEAMKLMNQIEADKAGTIKEILVKDGTPIEYGQALFVIA